MAIIKQKFDKIFNKRFNKWLGSFAKINKSLKLVKYL